MHSRSHWLSRYYDLHADNCNKDITLVDQEEEDKDIKEQDEDDEEEEETSEVQKKEKERKNLSYFNVFNFSLRTDALLVH